MKKPFFVFLFLLLIPTMIQAQQEVQLVIEKATYRYKQRSFRIDVYWLNNSPDTISAIIPQGNQFSGNLYYLSSTDYVGELKKPYTIAFRQEGTCEGQEPYTPKAADRRKSHLYNFQVVTVPPGRRSKKIVISLGADHNFCTESKYFASISYDPKYQSLDPQKVKKLEGFQEEYKDIEKQVKEYLIAEGLPVQQRRPALSLMEIILANNELIENLTPIQFSTQEVEIVKQ